MPREAKAKKRARAVEVCRRMDELYPVAPPALDFKSPFECVTAVALSAQTTDANVNKVTPELFRRWPTPQAMAQANQADIEEVIHAIGFFRTKAKACIDRSRMIMTDFGGEVPRTMGELQRLPGVGRKTANIVLNECFDVCEGIAVDTHVFRIAHKLKLSSKKTAADTERDLLDLLPRELWKTVNAQWIRFGREWCDARKPRCMECPLGDICPSMGK